MKKEINNFDIIDLFNLGNNCSEIAIKFNCSAETIRLRLKKEGINTEKKICNIKCVHCGGNSRKEGKTVYGKQRYSCLDCKKIFVSDFNEQKKNMLIKHSEIKKMYLIDNLSTTEIGKKLGISSTVPQRILKKYKLTRDIGLSKELQNANNLGLSYDEYIKRLPVFKKYRKLVIRVTNKQTICNLKNSDKRGKCGTIGAYQLDHKYSILEGFKNGIDAEIIGNINNLEFITWEDNLKKSSKCSISLVDLLLIIE